MQAKVLNTCQCSDKILGYDELVHEGWVIMMFMNQFIVTQNFITALTGDKYFIKFDELKVLIRKVNKCCPFWSSPSFKNMIYDLNMKNKL